MGLMFACSALGGCLTGIIGFCVPALRNVERDLPDAV
jgi:hypothetical protein